MKTEANKDTTRWAVVEVAADTDIKATDSPDQDINTLVKCQTLSDLRWATSRTLHNIKATTCKVDHDQECPDLVLNT